MKKLFIFLILLFSCTSISFAAVAHDMRISDNDGQVLNINSDGSLPVNFGSGQIILSPGNVGIGTSSPEAEFVVNGDAIIKGAEERIEGSKGGFIDFDEQSGGAVSIGSTSAGGVLKILSTDTTAAKTMTLEHDDTNGNITVSSGVVRIRANLSVGQNNVGIGTISPVNVLEVRGTSVTTNPLVQFRDAKSGTNNYTVAINRLNSGTAAMFLGNNSSSNGLIVANNTDLVFGRDSAGTFTERMRMTNGGNFGIGTANPEMAFTIRIAGPLMVRKTGANTACTTTCGTAACYFGQDTADFSNEDCADTTSDVCFCAGQ